MKDNSLRLRLMKGEVDTFEREGSVSSTTTFGPLPEQALRYTLRKSADSQPLRADFEGKHITVSVPAALGSEWAGTERVGFEGHMPLNGNEALFILVEKDFRCLQDRPHEDETDAFPNPLEESMGSAC